MKLCGFRTKKGKLSKKKELLERLGEYMRAKRIVEEYESEY